VVSATRVGIRCGVARSALAPWILVVLATSTNAVLRVSHRSAIDLEHLIQLQQGIRVHKHSNRADNHDGADSANVPRESDAPSRAARSVAKLR